MVLSAGPDASTLLSTALEKLLYLESRLEASEAAREATARDVDRLRQASAELRRTLGDWQRRASRAEVAAESAEREAMNLRAALEKARSERPAPVPDSELALQLREASERLERFERERETWLDRMVALGRLRSDADDGLDLGSFIAELRAELMALRRGETDRQRATLGDRPAPPDAQALLDTLPGTRPDPETLVREARLPRPERTLALLCARDLESDVPSVRCRGVERLTEAGIGVLNPFVVEHLHEEPDPLVRAAIVALLGRTGGEAEALVVEAARRDADPRVRVAAVEVLARRGALDWLRAVRDEAPAVRRRVLALLPRTVESLDVLDVALRDDDPTVRRVAALALSSRSGVEAVALLQAVAAVSDEAVAAIARETLLRRGLPLEPPSVDEEAPIAPDEAPVAPAQPETSDQDPVRYELDDRVMDEVRAALRGRTAADLEALLDVAPEEIEAATGRLVAAGVAVWRGPKLYPS